MNLQNNQRIFDAEIVINRVIKLSRDGNVENKDDFQKCPHCHIGIGRVFHRGVNDEARNSETGFVCNRCSKRWALRFKNPILFIKICD